MIDATVRFPARCWRSTTLAWVSGAPGRNVCWPSSPWPVV